ncbi:MULTISPECIES: hypothetical protein [Staphylococcus]|nr:MULTISPECIES: hypothetical protein [Staphylococcus]MDT3893185.1 hypothetical protein [Staphylococcus arlettae]MDT4051150.1 hypothetical protein [Staphylococcus arlettae]
MAVPAESVHKKTVDKVRNFVDSPKEAISRFFFITNGSLVTV